MKKNIAMRLASGLMLSCLLSTCVISGTFAKYTTSGFGEDSARVAKWGVEVEVPATLFAKAYGTDKVVSTTDKVVAPNTNGELAQVNVTGTPEVKVNVTYAADLQLSGWKLANDSVYCPITITVGTTDYTCTGTLADFETAVENAIRDVSKTYNANQNLDQVNDDLIVTWAWTYSTTPENDKNDTYLGEQAAEGNASTIKLIVTTTITQAE